MKLVIIPIDNAVYVDDFSYFGLDLTSCNIPQNVHALQWNQDKGWIEFVEDENFKKEDNQLINELPDWAFLAKNKWDEAKVLENEKLKSFEIPVVDVS